MKKLLVTGASGFLGWNICIRKHRQWNIFGTMFAHNAAIGGVTTLRTDLTHYPDLKRIFQEIRPDAVIHAAAASHPNFCQNHQSASRKINVDAAIIIAGLCADASTPCVFTSTDMVFDGLNAPYREEDPVCPVSVYGEHKVLAEQGMARRYPPASICRLPLMFGEAGPAAASFVQPMLRAMRKGREIALFTDEFRTPVSAETAVQGLSLVLEKNIGGILHLGGQERISRFDFGLLLAQAFGLSSAKVKPCLQQDVPMAAPRAPDVSLDSTKALRLGFKPRTLKEELERLITAL